MSIVIAILPTIGLYVLVSAAFARTVYWPLLVGLVGFGYGLYHKEDRTDKAGATAYYLSIEAFLFPIAMLALSLQIAWDQVRGIAMLGAGIGGTIVVVVSCVFGWSLAAVFYAISHRLER